MVLTQVLPRLEGWTPQVGNLILATLLAFLAFVESCFSVLEIQPRN